LPPTPASRPSSPAFWRGLLQRLRVPYKVLLGASMLLLPTLVLLHYFRLTVDNAIVFAQRERCGLALDAPLRRLLEQTAPAEQQATLARLRELAAQPCAGASSAELLGMDGAADALARQLAAGAPRARLEAQIQQLRSALGDRSNLILDPDLDTYYIVDFLLYRFPEGLDLLAPEGPVAATPLRQHRERLQRGLGTAVQHNDYYRQSRGTLEPAIAAARERYLAALRALEAGGDGAARRQARSALFALYDDAAAWEDRALRARIDDRRQWKQQTYAIVAAALLLGGAFAWLAVHSTVRRLMELVALSRRMARGELGLAVRVEGRDEIAQLQDSFNTMAADLGQLYASMERRIQEGTAAAQAAEARFRAVVEAAPDALLLADAGGRILLVNAQAEALFGYARSELLGQAVEMLVPARSRAQHVGERQDYGRAPSSRPMGAGRDLHGLRKDGQEIPVEIGLNAMATPDGTFVLASVIDISQRKAAEQLLRVAEAHALRSHILDNLPVSVIATDTGGLIVAVNPAAERLLGYAREELVGRPALLVHDPEELQRRALELSTQLQRPVPPDFEVIVAAGRQGAADEREWNFLRKDGSRLPVQIAITALRNDGGHITGFLQVASDISARKRAEAYIEHMVQHDALTGLPNRTLLLDRLDMALRQAQRHGQQVVVLLLDLDQFKHVNDSLGHRVGDQLLALIGDRLERAVRDIDTVARLGGDEFAIVVPEVRSKEDAAPVIAKLFAAVTESMYIDGHELQLTPSIGACLFPADGDEAAILLKKADAAMYRAKAQGRNTAQWFTETMLLASQEKLALGVALRHALDNGEMRLHYQPEVSLRTGRVVGIEALLRWQRDGDSVAPDRFVAIAEDTGLILPLGEWALRHACHECVALQQQLQRRLTIAVNVSPRQFQQKGWLQIVRSALEDSGLHPNQLELEITEGMLMQNPEESAELLRAVRRLGVGVVIDDFGTGYSSLAYLTRFPIDKLKIDRAFVRDLVSDAADAAIVNAILAMAQRLGIRVIAEGVESVAQQDYLRQQGCDEAQGFLYSRGLSFDELAQQLDRIETAVSLQPAASSGAHAA